MRHLFWIACFVVVSCGEKHPEPATTQSAIESTTPESEPRVGANETVTQSEKPQKKALPFQAKAFFTEGSGWGYDILENNAVRIHQPHIPAIPGNNGFSSEQDALKAADLVIQKLVQGINPPSLSKEEMQQAGIRLVP